MKILIVGEYGAINGGENSLLAILPRLQYEGHSFEALVPPDSEFSYALESTGVTTHPFVPGSGPTRKSQEEIRGDIKSAIQKIAPDLVHANSLSASRLVGPVTAELSLPSLGYLRDIIGLSKKAVSDINMLDRIVAVSAATREHHINQSMDGNKIVVVHNGVDLNAFKPATDRSQASLIREELDIPADSHLAIYIGQIGMRKGVDTLLESFQLALQEEQGRELHLAIIGARHSQKDEAIEHENRLHEMCKPFAARVHWLGRRMDIADIMRGATVLLHAARQEPLGRVLLEASAVGLPVIATNVGGTPEIIGDSPINLMCPPDDAVAMARLLTSLLETPKQLDIVSKHLRSNAEKKFENERCARDLDQLYRSLVG